MRGKGGLHLFAADRQGITPAYAGKSDQEILGPRNAEDHPRLCGEKPCSKIFVKGVSGSPPPMRGKAVQLDFARPLKGITPAYAGKSDAYDNLLNYT